MPRPIASLLDHRAVAVFARLLLTLPFWGSGLDKLFGFPQAVAEMQRFGLEPAGFYAVATIATQLVGSALVIANRAAWLGAGALGIFTALTIPIAHPFWTMGGEAATHHFHTAVEHLGMIGGLLLASILATRPATTPAPYEVPMTVVVGVR